MTNASNAKIKNHPWRTYGNPISKQWGASKGNSKPETPATPQSEKKPASHD